MDEFSLQDRVVVITGGAGRLGTRFAQAVLRHGGRVCLLDPGFTNSERVSDRELRLSVDITDPGQVKEAAEEIRRNMAPVFGLINNACLQPEGFFRPMEQYSLETWRKVMAVNLDGLFLCSQVFGGDMAKRGEGSVVNISSIYGMNGPDFSLYEDLSFNTPPSYAASKAAVLGLTRYLAAYWGSCGVRVNAITPGGVQDGQLEIFVNRYSKRTPLGRMAEKHEMDGAAIFLLSDASSYVTGHNLAVDGGWSAW
ncbi:SDR family oxidoreductase [Brevibacillus sp. NRS-1366]|uniref:SDR family oxidoreductase n=1 Tax=Brevibacillus sp. NRS-1366 TaxID=3233899 RepID=UPI003D255E85